MGRRARYVRVVATEPCEIRARGGLVTTGSAVTERFGSARRWVRSAGIVGFGLLAGLLLTPVPGLHLVAPWLLPLLCAGIALYLLGVRFRLDAVQGTCPVCGGAVSAERLGLVRNEEIWIRCDQCGGPLVIEVPRDVTDAWRGR